MERQRGRVNQTLCDVCTVAAEIENRAESVRGGYFFSKLSICRISSSKLVAGRDGEPAPEFSINFSCRLRESDGAAAGGGISGGDGTYAGGGIGKDGGT